jgi:hypothetical protein
LLYTTDFGQHRPIRRVPNWIVRAFSFFPFCLSVRDNHIPLPIRRLGLPPRVLDHTRCLQPQDGQVHSLKSTYNRSMMLTTKISLLSTLTLVHFLPAARAAITLHYFPQASCNTNTALSEYTSSEAASSDSACHSAPAGTAAIYIDGIDDGCTGKSPRPVRDPPVDLLQSAPTATSPAPQ